MGKAPLSMAFVTLSRAAHACAPVEISRDWEKFNICAFSLRVSCRLDQGDCWF